MKSKAFNLPTVGQVIIAKHHKSRRITLRIKPGEAPKVIIPNLMTYKMGLNFAIEKTDWIIKNKQKLDKNIPKKRIYNETNGFKSQHTTINFITEGHKLNVKKSNNNYLISFPEGTNFENDRIQNLIRNFITETLRNEAKTHLTSRLNKLASQYQFKFNKVFIKNMKTRWGSCSGVNNINLNLILMCLPEHLSDFILLHELCHTVHKNHGQKFHELLNKICGNEKLLNKELRKYSINTLI